MKFVLHALALASVSALSACTTVQPQPGPDPAPARQTQDVARNDGDDKLTGSRIPGKRTDRMLRSVGSQDYKDSKASQPNPLRSE
jgi:hypothetical protein